MPKVVVQPEREELEIQAPEPKTEAVPIIEEKKISTKQEGVKKPMKIKLKATASKEPVVESKTLEVRGA